MNVCLCWLLYMYMMEIMFVWAVSKHLRALLYDGMADSISSVSFTLSLCLCPSLPKVSSVWVSHSYYDLFPSLNQRVSICTIVKMATCNKAEN